MTSLARATALMTFGTVLSRVTGLLRIAAIAAALGVAESRLADTYNLANTAPNIIYELVLGGVLTSVFIPVFVELMEKEGKEKAWEVASAILNLSLTVLTAVALIGITLAPAIARFYVALRSDGVAAEQQAEVLAFLLRLFFPQIVFYGLAALTAGLLNAHRRFGAPMYTPVLNNLAVIGVFAAYAVTYGDSSRGLDEVETSQILLMGLGTTAGVVLMALAQLPFLKGLGRYRLTWSVAHPAVKKLARLSVFVIGYVIVNQIGYLIVQLLANKDQGAYSAYVNAFTFFMLPHGLFAVSIMTALLPGMSQDAVGKNWGDFRERLSTGIRATLFLVVPAAVGYLLLAEPIVRFLLERGVMTPRSSQLVADVLKVFVLGLVPFSIFQLMLRAYYAMQDTRTPFVINCGAVAIQTAMNVPLFAVLGVRGLAAGHAVSYVFGISMQGMILRRRLGGLDGRRILRSSARVLAAVSAMGASVVATLWVIRAATVPGGLSITLEAVIPVAVGAGAYLAASRALRVEEASIIWNLLRRDHSGVRGGRLP